MTTNPKNANLFMYPNLRSEFNAESTGELDAQCLNMALEESDSMVKSATRWVDYAIAFGTDQLWDEVY